MAELVIDLYSTSFVRARVIGHTPVDGVPFDVTPVLATADTVGPDGAPFHSTNALVTHGGTVWYDAGGTLGKVHNGDTDADMTANAIANRITSGDTFDAVTSTEAGTGHPILTITAKPAVVPPPADAPGTPAYPITGLDVAHALGLPAATPAMDTAAVTACQLIGEYLDRDKVTALAELPQPIVEACLVIAIDVLQNRTAAGGQSVGIDGGVGPYRMGRSLLDRVTGLLGPWLDQRSELA